MAGKVYLISGSLVFQTDPKRLPELPEHVVEATSEILSWPIEFDEPETIPEGQVDIFTVMYRNIILALLRLDGFVSEYTMNANKQKRTLTPVYAERIAVFFSDLNIIDSQAHDEGIISWILRRRGLSTQSNKYNTIMAWSADEWHNFFDTTILSVAQANFERKIKESKAARLEADQYGAVLCHLGKLPAEEKEIGEPLHKVICDALTFAVSRYNDNAARAGNPVSWDFARIKAGEIKGYLNLILRGTIPRNAIREVAVQLEIFAGSIESDPFRVQDLLLDTVAILNGRLSAK